MDSENTDTLMRMAAFEHVRRLSEVHDHLTATELNPGFAFEGERIPLINPQRANRPWSDEERFAVIDAAPIHLKVPIALAMFTGLREGDVLALVKTAYDDKSIERRTGKTGQLVSWPCPSALKKILDGAPAHNSVTIAANSRGMPWTQSGFRASWRKLRLLLEGEGKIAPGLTIHGLRHTVATILAEEGFDNRTIADALGQATEGMAQHYSREADRRKKMVGVVRKFDLSENKKRSKTVKPA